MIQGKPVHLDALDLTKFILSIVIVAIHTQFLGELCFPFARIAVPIFFMISAYLFFSKNQTYSGFALSHFCKRNLQLYLFWFVVLLPVTVYARKYFFSGFFSGLMALLRDFLFGSTFAASWYIMAQVIAIVLLALASRRIRNSILMVISGLYAICLLSSNYYGLIVGTFVQRVLDTLFLVIFPPNSFPVALFWCAIGKVIADKGIEATITRRVIAGTVFAISIAGLYLEHFCIKRWIGNIKANDVYLCLIPACISAFVLILHCPYHIRWALTLRRISTIVYCVHCSIAWVISNLLERVMVDSYGIACFFVTLAISWGVSCIILLLHKKIIILRYAF